ncbi:flagellar biosynthesis anti-sigma factor FlgM [Shewanella sp. SR44-3]|uniref:flagellar biosynthesis anti-sigma factor FlgM n=1 Tax=unclassified Shewanella TaxID=196818 RepID=UPI0015F946B1|nr:flagellar biosynthesis anti-sigma factor FlgM [Shewanella sp. SR44-3]MBB1268107.1 flagellar biosynthesis anti-sigma factor FlgM [Shewanella sp. SR44-3]
MAIDINKLNTTTPLRANRDMAAKANDTATKQSTSSVKTDSVSITSQAQQLQSAQAKMSSLPEIDQKKVAEIKLAITEGRYKVDPEKLAANIASFEAELSELGLDAE